MTGYIFLAYALLVMAIIGVFLLAKQAQDEARRRHNEACSNHACMCRRLHTVVSDLGDVFDQLHRIETEVTKVTEMVWGGEGTEHLGLRDRIANLSKHVYRATDQAEGTVNRQLVNIRAEVEACRQAVDILTSDSDRRLTGLEATANMVYTETQRVKSTVDLTQRTVGNLSHSSQVHHGKEAVALTIIADKLGVDTTGAAPC